MRQIINQDFFLKNEKFNQTEPAKIHTEAKNKYQWIFGINR